MRIMKTFRSRHAIRLITICLTILVLSAFAPQALAKQAINFQTMKVTSSTLNVRARAGTEFEIVGLLKKGQAVELLGESAGWSHIKWHEAGRYNTGYVSSRYIKKSGPVLYYAKEPVNVRSSAGVGNNLIGMLDAAEAVVYVKKVGKWSLVEYNGVQGYVYSKYLTKNQKECFLAHPIAATIGNRNISEIAYTFAPKPLDGINTSIVPLLEVSYNVRMKSRDNSLLVTVYRFDSAQKAQQVRSDINKTTIHPGWTRTFFQKDETIICFDLKGLDFTKSEMQLLEGIRAALRSQYGEQIAFA